MKCRRCKEDKNSDDFYKSDPRGWCKLCRHVYNKANRHKFRQRDREYAAQYRNKFPDKVKTSDRNAKLKAAYGITSTDFAALAASQSYLCKICLRKRKLHVDHDHKSGAIRGLLCDKCNRGLGFFDEIPAVLDSATRYLQLSVAVD